VLSEVFYVLETSNRKTNFYFSILTLDIRIFFFTILKIVVEIRFNLMSEIIKFSEVKSKTLAIQKSDMTTKYGVFSYVQNT
jgi:hypothetical protein